MRAAKLLDIALGIAGILLILFMVLMFVFGPPERFIHPNVEDYMKEQERQRHEYIQQLLKEHQKAVEHLYDE